MKNQDINKVLVIGSGPIVIGQAAEFDYAGTQACLTLKEEGVEVVLVNSNPATIMTDNELADKVYMEPLTIEYLEEIIRIERPQGILATLGGQVGLNLGEELMDRGILARYQVELLGTNEDAIKKAEDRESFKEMLVELNQPVLESGIVSTKDEALKFASSIGYPIIVRPAYTLGGSGGGIAYNESKLSQIVERGLHQSRIKQLLIEKCVLGWKEIEYEVIRDADDNCLIVCDMENVDAVGVHTGDSIVAAPGQTLTAEEQHMLRTSSKKIIRKLGLNGGCNIQFALNSETKEYYVIEVNPRLSRSSALASKATSYPIARVATRIALGYSLDEIRNHINPKLTANQEPQVEYTVVKIPRWPFDKFQGADRSLGSQMKATGEVMAIGNNFETALLKGIRSLEIPEDRVAHEVGEFNNEKLEQALKYPDDRRLWCVFSAFERGYSIEDIYEMTYIPAWFLTKIKGIVDMKTDLYQAGAPDKELYHQAKSIGISNDTLVKAWNVDKHKLEKLEKEWGITPYYHQIYPFPEGEQPEKPVSSFYSDYHHQGETHVNSDSDSSKVLVIGSGPIRIGQGIEFDYSAVRASWALKDLGSESIVINNNPETVSTDFDTSDKLYFEPLTEEDVLNVVRQEKPDGVILQFGGQTAVNLARPLKEAGINILGTDVDNMDLAEDREKFNDLLTKLNIPFPLGKTARDEREAEELANSLGFPVLVRPSYVLGGRAMEIVHNLSELREYLEQAVTVSPEYPVLVDSYLNGREVEIDAVSDGTDVLIPGIMEHVERAGVHSGDSTAVYPSQSFKEQVIDKIVDYTTRLARGLEIKGIFNIQYVVYQGEVYVLEVNPRSSRTVPFISKMSGIPLVEVATKCMLGQRLTDLNYGRGLVANQDISAVKMPVFSFSKLIDVETSLGPEMKSTGEVVGIDREPNKAMYKAFQAAGFTLPEDGTVLVTISDKDKQEALPMLKRLYQLGYNLVATEGTKKALTQYGIPVKQVNKVSEGSPHVVDIIRDRKVDLVINSLTLGKTPKRDGFKIRRAGVEYGIPCITSLDTFSKLLQIFESRLKVKAVQDYNLKG